MTNFLDSDSQLENTPPNLSTTDINQKVVENKGQAIGQTFDSVIVNTLNIYQSHAETTFETKTNPTILGENPYKGLEAFDEDDRDRFFGRDAEIRGENGLLKRFQNLRHDQNAIRILPVYGASGSGKSSLVKAGLVPILRDGLKDGECLVLMKPSGDPIGELAKVLAHNIIDNPVPVREISDFKTWLLEQNEVPQKDGTKDKNFDGLHRIINSAKCVKSLILVIDQFEEIYTYGTPKDQCDAFIENLLCAANAAKYSSRKVSVILTMRIDFVGKTHECPELNALFASPPGVYVPTMQREQLALAISEPAKRSGCKEITEETIALLLEQSRGQEGALPLLQFALMQIWEGLLQEPQVKPAKTLANIGGVGGALANKAQETYDSLKTDQEKQIARCIFLKLILLNDDNRATRRRASISDLLIGDHKEQSVREVVARFAQSKVRILVTSATIDNPNLETVEIAHEALIDNWEELKGWLRENKKAILQRDEIERLRYKWESQNKSKDYFLQGRILRDAIEFQETIKNTNNKEVELPNDASKFILLSQREQKNDTYKRFASTFIFPTLILTPLIFHFGTLFIANQIIYKKGCDRNLMTDSLLQYQINFGGKRELSNLELCNEYLSLVDFSREKLSRISDVNFSEADLSSAKFFKNIIRNSNFKAAKLFNTNFYSTKIINSTFEDTHFFNTNLTESIFINGNYQNTSFKDAILKDTIFIRANLSMTDLDSSQISKIKICDSELPPKNKTDKNRDCSFPLVKKYINFQ